MLDKECGMGKKYYTPEQYKAAFHEPWGERDAVYFADYADTDDAETAKRFWRVGTLGDLRFMDGLEHGDVLCATTHCPADDYFHLP